jgi:hypothetical protein
MHQEAKNFEIIPANRWMDKKFQDLHPRNQAIRGAGVELQPAPVCNNESKKKHH